MCNNTAVLMVCFNRKLKTLQCLKQLFEIAPTITVYLVDDGSTDGTSEAIRQLYPNVLLIEGNGNLYWNRGMHLAWGVASNKNYDYYIWLNDDVIPLKESLSELFKCSEIKNNEAIISGIIISEISKKTLYGGTCQNNSLWAANGLMNPIENMNGNFVLVSRGIYEKLGNLDPFFHHDIGDVDYGLRAKKTGIGVFTTRIPIGFGQPNDICRVRLNNTNVFNRFIRLYSPKGSNPFIIFYFLKRHKGFKRAILYFFFIHFLNLIPDNFNYLLFGKRYA
jgi:GT2 family glycosyltransferase